MYANKTHSVPVPHIKGIKIYKNGYVYYASSQKWDNEKKRPVDNRRIIGKIDSSREGYMFPNHTFSELLPEYLALSEPSQSSDTQSFGAFAVLEKSAAEIGLLQPLQHNFPELWKEMLALAAYMICTQSSVSQGFEGWFFHNYAGLADSLSSQDISRIYKEIGLNEEARKDCLAQFRELYMKQIPHHNDQTVIAFDSTNQNTASDNIVEAAYGKAKKDEGLPCVATAMFVDEMDGVPVWYETFCGSLTDKTETPFTLEKAADLGFRNLFLVMDRGYCSKSVVQAIQKLSAEQEKENSGKMGFVISCPENLTFVKETLALYSKDLIEKESNYIYPEKAYGMRIPCEEIFGTQCWQYFFYDPATAEYIRENIHETVMNKMQLALKKKRYSEGLVKSNENWLIIEPAEKSPVTGRNFTVRVNEAAIQEKIDKAGYFVAISNEEMDAEEMLAYIRTRDRSEKAFSTLKTQLDMEKSHCHSSETYNGKMFVAFLALVIRQAYQWFIRDTLATRTSMSVHSSLMEMNKYDMYRKEDGNWAPKYAMTNIQKKLGQNIKIDEAYLIKRVRSL